MSKKTHKEYGILVWLDTNIDNNSYKLIRSFEDIVKEVKIFTEPNACIDDVTNMKHERVLLIISGSISEQIAPLVHQLPQIDSIFIFCTDQKSPERWTSRIRKVKGIFTDFDSFRTELIEYIITPEERYHLQFETVTNIQSQSFSYLENRNKQEATFMYSQLLKEIFLNMCDDNRQEMIDFFRRQHPENQAEQKFIDEFERDYESNRAILWYTREGFLYKMINRATREQDIDVLYKVRTFISHLHEQLVYYHRIQRDDVRDSRTIMLYRGQRMSNEEFEKLNANQGGLISLSNFLSTTEIQEVAIIYAGITDVQTTAVLLEIPVDLTIETTSTFACIQSLSHFGEGEREWLFSMGSVFRIQCVEKMPNGVCRISLTMTNEHDKQLQEMTSHLRTAIRIGQMDSISVLASLLHEMGNYTKAIEFLQMNLASEIDWTIRASNLNTLGLVYTELDLYQEALTFYKQSIDIQHEKGFFENDSSLYQNMGMTCGQMGQNDLAHDYLRCAIGIEISIEHPDQALLAKQYNNLGSVLCRNNQLSEGISYYRIALDIRLHSLPPTHPLISTSYNNISGVYFQQKHYQEALQGWLKSLDIDKASLHPNHVSIAKSHHNVATCLDKLARYDDSLFHFQQAFDIYLKHYPPDHPALAFTYNNMGAVFSSQGRKDKAFEMFKKSLDIELACPSPSHHSNLVCSYNNMACILTDLRRFKEALEYSVKAAEIAEKTLGSDHHETIACKRNLQTLRQVCSRMAS